MVNQYGRTATWNSEITFEDKINAILEIDDFIFSNAKNSGILETRLQWYHNFFKHLFFLYDAQQILIQRTDDGNIRGVLGWIMTNKHDLERINKTRWAFPRNVNNGNILYVTFCVVRGGDLGGFRRKLRSILGNTISEVRWFNLPKNRFVKRKMLGGINKHGIS